MIDRLEELNETYQELVDDVRHCKARLRPGNWWDGAPGSHEGAELDWSEADRDLREWWNSADGLEYQRLCSQGELA